MSGQFEFRGVLLKIQDLLSDHDRQRLHFLLGKDVPRHLRDDPSLGGTLSVLQSLFDKDIINGQDCNYLIEALTKIRCLDAAHRLQDYQRNQQQSDSNSLSLIDILSRETAENDKMVTHWNNNEVTDEELKDVSTPIETPPSNLTIFSSWKENICQPKLSCRECLFVTIIVMSLMVLIVVSRPWAKIKADYRQPKIDQSMEPITNKRRWSSNGTTVLGGNQFTSLNYPRGIAVRRDGTMYVADFSNNRIVEKKSNSSTIRTLLDTNQPTDVLIERDDETLIICDYGNQQLIRWSPLTSQSEVLNIAADDCRGLTMDNRGYLYVSDASKHEVRRYRIGEENGKVIAGGHGEGNEMNQFAHPLYIAIDDEYSIYVSDTNNNRVMKWKENAKEGVIVAGGFDSGNGLEQLDHPLGIYVDPGKNIYVVDSRNRRVMRWRENMEQGEIVVKDIGMHYPVGLAFDAHWNMYLVDGHNHRVLKFDLLP